MPGTTSTYRSWGGPHICPRRLHRLLRCVVRRTVRDSGGAGRGDSHEPATIGAASWDPVSAFVVAILLCCTAALAEDNTIWPTKGCQTSTPEEQGMDSAALAKLVEFETSRRFDSLLISRHGRIVLDAYYPPYTADTPHDLFSATKSVMGTLTAIAFRDGLLDSSTIQSSIFIATAMLLISTTGSAR
jgi:hypothetical protein